MVIESGIIIFVGLLLLFIKLPAKLSLILLGSPLILDIAVSVFAYIIHWGTFTGVMAAAVAGLMCSAFTSAGAKLFGKIKGGRYYPGVFDVRPTLRRQQIERELGQ